MFYINKDLFERQSYVDQIIDDIAFTLGVNRDALNVVSSCFHPMAILLLTALRLPHRKGLSRAAHSVQNQANWFVPVLKKASSRS